MYDPDYATAFEDEQLNDALESSVVVALASTSYLSEDNYDSWGFASSSLHNEIVPNNFLAVGASTISLNDIPPAEPKNEAEAKPSRSGKGKKKFKGKGREPRESHSLPALNPDPVHCVIKGPSPVAAVTIQKPPRERAMENQDILGEIFNIISFDLEKPGNNSSQTRRSLFSVARTCRVFLDPALNALWRILPSVFPLLKVLPSFQLANNQYILPDVQTEEWSILESYARRVRVIRVEYNFLRSSASPLVYLRLNQLRGLPLFPALKELCIPANVNVDLFSPFSMLSPEMQRLELNHTVLSNSELFRPFFCFATTASPNVTHLVLRGDITIDLDPTMFRFRSLRTLELYLSAQIYEAPFFRKLGLLTNLRSLTLLLSSSNAHQHGHGTLNIPRTHRHSFVQRIEILQLRGSLVAMSEAMQYMSCNSLIAVTLEETAPRGHDASWTECFELLFAGVQSVKKVVIAQHPSYNYSLSCAHLIPLYQLHNLEVLELKNGQLSLSETDFITLISAFPKLEKLCLPDACSHSCPPISVLWRPSIIPPALKELRICFFNAGTWLLLPEDLKDTEINRSVGHHGLRRLSISSSFRQISDINVIQLARLLDCAYPNLDVVEGCGINALNGYESWNRVDLFRAALRDIRRKM